MTERTVVGLQPVLPRPLDRWEWMTAPIRAERLAALRVAVGLVLLLDILGTYLPRFDDFFGPGSLSSPDVFASRFEGPYWYWSVLRWLPETWGPQAALAVWVASAAALTLGFYPRSAAVLAWALSLSFWNSAYYLHNSGDRLRHELLFFLMLCPCGAVWALTRQRRPVEGPPNGRPVFVPPWAVRLLFVLMVVMYFMNGVHKALGPQWIDGSVMHNVFGNVGWSRWPTFLPGWAESLAGWAALAWELSFPVLVLRPTTRVIALWIGAAFHVVTGFALELGMFQLYALCLYVPLLPWERWADRFSKG
jgi:hypothetical protein